MADNFIQGTVDPLLPLQPWHLAVLDINKFLSYGEVPPGLEVVGSQLVITDKQAFLDYAKEDLNYDGENFDKVIEGLSVLYRCHDEILNLMAEPCEEGKFYLYSEDGLGEPDLEFLKWVILDMPPEIQFISTEFAFYCSKLRPGEFGGGAWFITRADVETMFTGSWLYAQRAKLTGAEHGHGEAGT